MGLLLLTSYPGGNVSTTPEEPVAPDAPTGGVVDNSADTFDFTYNPLFPNLSDNEKTLNGGSTVSDLSAKPIVVGNVNKAPGQVGVRVKAVGENPPSAWLFNATSFTAEDLSRFYNSINAGLGNSLIQYPNTYADITAVEYVHGHFPYNVGAAFHNYGTNGVGITTGTPSLTDQVENLAGIYDAGKMCIAYVWELYNELDNTDLQGSVDKMWTVCDDIRSQGWKVVLMGVLPTHYNDTGDTLHAGINALLRAQWADHADAFVDVELDERLALGSGNYAVDNTHLNTAGQQIAGELALAQAITLV
jgi:hypothetical protein